MDEQMRNKLHMEIMNISCNGPAVPLTVPEQKAYKLGHRDARHAAAELVTAAALSQPAAAPDLLQAAKAVAFSNGFDAAYSTKVAALRAAIAKATPKNPAQPKEQ